MVENIDIYKIVSQHNEAVGDGSGGGGGAHPGGKKSDVRSIELTKENDASANAKKTQCCS